MREPHLIEFQVRQTGTGIDVAVRASGPLDVVRLRSDLRETLVRSGMGDPDVTVWPADHLTASGRANSAASSRSA